MSDLISHNMRRIGKAMSQATITDVSLNQTFDRLAQISKLPPNWDSYGAEPVSSVAVVKACQLLVNVKESCYNLVGEKVLPFTVAPLADGGVQVEWRGTMGVLEVEISPDGEFGYLSIAGEGNSRKFEEKDPADWEELLSLVL